MTPSQRDPFASLRNLAPFPILTPVTLPAVAKATLERNSRHVPEVIRYGKEVGEYYDRLDKRGGYSGD